MNKTAFGWRASLFAAAGLQILSASSVMAEEVTVWLWDINFNGAAMAEAAARYSAEHPDVTITVVEMGKADVEQKLQTQLASGVTEGLPDIVLIEDYGAQKYLQSFPGAFAPLNEALDYSRFADYKVELATLNGETYSLPFDSGVTGLFYRSDILAEAGYSAADLENITWSRFVEIAEDVRDKTGHPMVAVDLNNGGLISIMLQSGGSWFFTPEGEPDIIGNAVLRASLESYQQILRTEGIWRVVGVYRILHRGPGGLGGDRRVDHRHDQGGRSVRPVGRGAVAAS